MSIFGSLIGGMIGFSLGGPFGMLLGSLLGGKISRSRTNARFNSQAQGQRIFALSLIVFPLEDQQFLFMKQKTEYKTRISIVGSEMCLIMNPILMKDI